LEAKVGVLLVKAIEGFAGVVVPKNRILSIHSCIAIQEIKKKVKIQNKIIN